MDKKDCLDAIRSGLRNRARAIRDGSDDKLVYDWTENINYWLAKLRKLDGPE